MKTFVIFSVLVVLLVMYTSARSTYQDAGNADIDQEIQDIVKALDETAKRQDDAVGDDDGGDDDGDDDDDDDDDEEEEEEDRCTCDQDCTCQDDVDGDCEVSCVFWQLTNGFSDNNAETTATAKKQLSTAAQKKFFRKFRFRIPRIRIPLLRVPFRIPRPPIRIPIKFPRFPYIRFPKFRFRSMRRQ